jgi:hypothetical protein
MKAIGTAKTMAITTTTITIAGMTITTTNTANPMGLNFDQAEFNGKKRPG